MFEMLDTLIHDGGCARRDCSLVHLCGYKLTLCNVYIKWEIVEIMGLHTLHNIA